VGVGRGLHVGASRNGVDLSGLADVWARASRAGRGFAPSEPHEGGTPPLAPPFVFLGGVSLIGDTEESDCAMRELRTRVTSLREFVEVAFA